MQGNARHIDHYEDIMSTLRDSRRVYSFNSANCLITIDFCDYEYNLSPGTWSAWAVTCWELDENLPVGYRFCYTLEEAMCASELFAVMSKYGDWDTVVVPSDIRSSCLAYERSAKATK